MIEGRNINNTEFALNNDYKYTPVKRSKINYSPNFKGANFTKAAQSGLIWISNNFSSPHQRAILGITALCTQPFIDLYNRHIKKEDKPITVSKTIAKIVAGTLVGIFMRYYAIKAVKNFTKTVKSGKYSQLLLPEDIVSKLKIDKDSVSESDLLNYRNGLGTFLGLVGCVFTNFAVDAPLSKVLTNVIYNNFLKNIFKKENLNEH